MKGCHLAAFCFMIKNIKYLFIPLFIVSCSSNKIYRDIDKSVNSFNQKHDYKMRLERAWNPTKLIFKELKDSLTKPTNIVYVFIWDNEGCQVARIECSALVYDRNSGKKFYIKGLNGFKLDIKHEYNAFSDDISEGFYIQDFIVENYLLGKIDYLHQYADDWFRTEGARDYYLLVEINSNQKVVNTFKSIIFDKNGNPIKLEDIEEDLPWE